ncbi:MAG: segregation/condensation protein A [Firmicutes bacterium]|nr:segregation/condensation protein A [Bacillota bacterium]
MNLQLQDFEGPFDLLLHLVRVSKMDIYTINISDIIEQYLEFINSIDKFDIDASSEYLVVSSELIHLKSKMLINKYNEEDIAEEEEYSIKSEEDLRNKLIEYERYKSMTDTFRILEENRQDYYTKLPENLNNYVEEEKIINSDVSVDDLVKAFLEMQRRVNFQKPITTKVTRKEFSVKERIVEIRNLLKTKKSLEFNELFDIVTKENIVITFLSLLDMSKNSEIIIKQDKIFSAIIIEGK